MNANVRKQMEAIREIQFIDADTGAPLVTVDGDKAQFLLENSELIQTIVEIGGQPNPNVLVVPIGDMGYGRQLLFRKILQGFPIGRIDYRDRVTFYPLSTEEEESIARAINSRNGVGNRNAAVNRERQNAIYETMRYLVIPDEVIRQMLLVEEEEYNRPEFSTEDNIEQMLRTHIYWLFVTGQKEKLTPTELEIATEFFDKIEKEYAESMKEVSELEKEQRKRNMARHKRFMEKVRSGRYQAYNVNNNNSNQGESYAEYRHREVEEEYDFATRADSYEPPNPDTTGGMTTRQLERWLRTVYFKKAPLELNQLHLNTLFNENQRALRGRVNKPKVIYVNENNTKTRKKKNNGRNKKNQPRGAGAGNNGSAW